jgi:hypothetical protein
MTKPGIETAGAFAAARKSRRCKSLNISECVDGLGAEALATGSTAATDHIAATYSCHAGAKAMAALADELGGLVSALHD